MTLDYVEVSTGDVLDSITLDGDQLVYTTGAARQMFETRMDRFGWTARRTIGELSGWSNGYAALRPRATP